MSHKPEKYYRGLTRKQKIQREKEIKSHSIDFKSPKAYTPFGTDILIKTKKSQYTRKWNTLYKNAKSLEEKANVTGIPLDVLKECYNRGMAAWRTGHRPGATQQQWGYARVSSLLLCGKTHYTADSDLVRKTRRNKWWKRCSTKHKM